MREVRTERGMQMVISQKKFRREWGALELVVPQVRGFGFYPQSIEKGFR
jgi:hypothetical protein